MDTVTVRLNGRTKRATIRDTLSLCGRYAVAVEPAFEGDGWLVLHDRTVLPRVWPHCPDAEKWAAPAMEEAGVFAWAKLVDGASEEDDGVVTDDGTLDLRGDALVKKLTKLVPVGSVVEVAFSVYAECVEGGMNMVGTGFLKVLVAEPYSSTETKSLVMFKGDKGDPLTWSGMTAEEKSALVAALALDPNCKGPKGDDGEDGADGKTGPQGPKGDKGDTGPQGRKGDTGPKGDKGDPLTWSGLTAEEKAYVIAQLALDPNCKGADGEDGADGAPGATGPQGPKGDTGERGPQGRRGETGPKGDKGDTGATGATGATGPQGPQGPQGIQGPPGESVDIVAPSTDASAEGKAADAKATGDALRYALVNLTTTTAMTVALPDSAFPIAYTLGGTEETSSLAAEDVHILPVSDEGYPDAAYVVCEKSVTAGSIDGCIAWYDSSGHFGATNVYLDSVTFGGSSSSPNLVVTTTASATLQDRSKNQVAVADGTTALVLSLPEPQTNRSRDFYVQVANSANASAVSLSVADAALRDSSGDAVTLSAPAGAIIVWHLTETNEAPDVFSPDPVFVVTGANELAAIAAKYAKPSGGIPKTDMAGAVQTSLGKADTAVQPAALRYDLPASATAISSASGSSWSLPSSAFPVVYNDGVDDVTLAESDARYAWDDDYLTFSTPDGTVIAGFNKTTGAFEYAFLNATYDGSSTPPNLVIVDYGEATLADRTANRVAITAEIAELRLTFPAAVSGKVRDFGLRVEVGDGTAALTAPALVPPAGVTLENPDAAIPALADGAADAKGVTLLYFSETAPGVFLVKGEQVKEA